MGRLHYLQDRAKLSRPIATKSRGIVENVSRGMVEEHPETYPTERNEDVTDWIPARLRPPSASEVRNFGDAKLDLQFSHVLVLHAYDESGNFIDPRQYDEIIVKYRRDGELVDLSARVRVTSAIQEVRKRSKVFSYTLGVVLDTEY